MARITRTMQEHSMVNDSKRHGINTLTEKVLKMMDRADRVHGRDDRAGSRRRS